MLLHKKCLSIYGVMMFQVFHKAKLFLKIVIPTFFGVEIPFIFTYEMTLRIDLTLGFFIA